MNSEQPRAVKTPSSSSKSSSPSTSRWERGGDFDVELIDARPGQLSFRATGKKAREAFANESGGHRYQRVPKTERRGRVHSSTITVAVLSEPTRVELRLDEKTLRWETTRGSGGGGQKRNKTESAVVLTHTPSGTRVRIESERSLGRNKELALSILRARLLDRRQQEAHDRHNRRRRGMIGSGERGDKRRTVAIQRGHVVDHETGQSTSWRNYQRGIFPGLWA